MLCYTHQLLRENVETTSIFLVNAVQIQGFISSIIMVVFIFEIM